MPDRISEMIPQKLAKCDDSQPPPEVAVWPRGEHRATGEESNWGY